MSNNDICCENSDTEKLKAISLCGL